MEHLNQQGRKDMQSQRTAIDVAGRSGAHLSGNAALRERVAPTPGRRPGPDSRSARKLRSRGAWLALTLGFAVSATNAQTITKIIDSTGDGMGNTLTSPRGIAVDALGNVYVAGGITNNAFKITPGGGDHRDHHWQCGLSGAQGYRGGWVGQRLRGGKREP